MKVTSLPAMLRNRLRRAEVYSKADYWDAKAAELDGDAVSMWPNNHLNRLYHAEQMALVDQWLDDVAGKDVLDVGCGTGRMSRHLASRGARVLGVDFAPRVVEIARRASPPGNPSYQVRSMFDLTDVAAYDVITSWGSLTVACRDRHDLLRAMRALHRALRPGGRLVVLEPIHAGFLHRVLDLDVDGFCDVMRQAGFAVDRVENLHFWPARLATAYFPLPRRFTEAVYRVGQALMAGVAPGLGDYKAIAARHSRIASE